MAVDTSFSALDGSAQAPAFSFLSAPTTGFFRDAQGNINIFVGGVRAASISAVGGLVSGSGPVAVTGAALAATVNAQSAIVTTETSLTTAAGATFTYVITNSAIKATSNVMVNVGRGTTTQGNLIVQSVTPSAGSVSVVVLNAHATLAMNGSAILQLLVA